MLKVFIGRDPRKPLDYNVLANSIVEHASVPVSITALHLPQLPIKRRGLTSFTFSRFLVPYLCNYQGQALFLDADMVVTGDIRELFAVPKDSEAKQVYVNQEQEKFEWASAMLFDCSLCEILTPQYIDNPKNSLFDFAWTESGGIGSFPAEWNKAVGYTPPGPAKLYHFTKGTPNWRETRGNVEDKYWNDAYKAMIHSCSFQDLMGDSVHVERMKSVC